MNTIFKTTCVFILLSTIHFCQSINLELLSRWPDGPCNSVEVNGSYAFINSGSALEILDISDTAKYKVIGKVDLNDFINDIKVSGNYAYIAGGLGVYIVDISNKSLPGKISTISADGPTEELFVKDNYLYAAGSVSLSIYDINSPSSPKSAGSFNRHTNGSSVFVKDSLAYLACPDSGLFVLNVKDKMNPYEIGHYTFSADEPVDIFINDSLAFITCREIPTTHLYTYGHLYILDIKDPANIFKRSGIRLHGFQNGYGTDNAAGNKVTAMGNYVYLTHFSDAGNYLVIANVSDPDNPREVTRMPADRISDLSINNNILYASAEHYGLLSFDISNPSAVKKLSQFSAAGNTKSVFRMGNYLFNANSFGGLKVINITDPFHPAEEFSFSREFGSESCDRIFGKDTVLYAGFSVYHWYSEASPFSSVNHSQLNFGLGNLPQLTKISELPADEISDLKVIGSYAYAATSYGFIIYDITNPASPAEIYRDSIANTFNPEISIGDKFLYAAARSGGVLVFNISNPAKTQLIKTIPVKFAVNVAASGKFLYVNDYRDCLRIFDITDPLAPREAGSYKDDLALDEIKVYKGNAYTINWG
ncbi:MAG: LVIVD repeat-containing protein, partial [Clostridiales bacterium]